MSGRPVQAPAPIGCIGHSIIALLVGFMVLLPCLVARAGSDDENFLLQDAACRRALTTGDPKALAVCKQKFSGLNHDPSAPTTYTPTGPAGGLGQPNAPLPTIVNPIIDPKDVPNLLDFTNGIIMWADGYYLSWDPHHPSDDPHGFDPNRMPSDVPAQRAERAGMPQTVITFPGRRP